MTPFDLILVTWRNLKGNPNRTFTPQETSLASLAHLDVFRTRFCTIYLLMYYFLSLRRIQHLQMVIMAASIRNLGGGGAQPQASSINLFPILTHPINPPLHLFSAGIVGRIN